MYFVCEIQKQQGGTASYIMTQHETRQEAESKFHQILSYAAVSTLETHSAVILDEEGTAQANQFYHHGGDS